MKYIDQASSDHGSEGTKHRIHQHYSHLFKLKLPHDIWPKKYSWKFSLKAWLDRIAAIFVDDGIYSFPPQNNSMNKNNSVLHKSKDTVFHPMTLETIAFVSKVSPCREMSFQTCHEEKRSYEALFPKTSINGHEV